MDTVLTLAERNVPRYTSYPTAPQFTAAVGPSTYADWLAAIPAGSTLSLYLHVPYCTEICLYCGCHTKAVRRSEPLDRYTDRLDAELARVAELAGSHRVVHIHWGGGTPSILGPERLARLVATIRSHFDLSALTEHAIELDPRRFDQRLADALAALGITRASLGVQDLTPQVQQAMGRLQPFDVVEAAFAALRGAGIDLINVDLMYGLPHQVVADVEQTAARIAVLSPSRLALFGYAHVPWFKANQKLIDAATLADPAERIAQHRAAARTLAAHGYVPIGLDHFARPDDALAVAQHNGRLRRNFQGYTSDEADSLLGFGASAIGRLPQGFVQNAVDIAAYESTIDGGGLATIKGIAVSNDDVVRGAVIERLMCDLAVDLDHLPAPAGGRPQPDFAAELDQLAPLVEAGIVHVDGRRISVTEDGRPFVRLVAAAFDTYLAQHRSRHSIAV